MPIISRTSAITRWAGVALACCATLAVAESAGAQGLRSTTSQVSLIVVKKETDERALITRDFTGPAPTVAAGPSLHAIGVVNLPPGVRAFVRAASGRLMQLGSNPIPVNPRGELLVRLQGPPSALTSIPALQLNAASATGLPLVLHLQDATRVASER